MGDHPEYPPAIASVLKGGARGRLTHRGGANMLQSLETLALKMGVMWPWAKERGQPPEPEPGRRDPPETHWREHSPVHAVISGFWPPGLGENACLF